MAQDKETQKPSVQEPDDTQKTTNEPVDKEPGNEKKPENGKPEVAVSDNAGVDTEVVEMLTTLLQSDPQLAAKIADTIEQHYMGGVNMFDISGPDTAGTAAAPNVPSSLPAANAPIGNVPPAATSAQSVPNDLIDRLSRIEQAQANMALDRELADVRKEYEDLKAQIPILPDLNDNELLKIALDNDGIPLKNALAIWAMQKMREGDGTIADRLMAAMMDKSKARGLPAVEGKGGSIPSGEAPPPQSMKDARNLAKERLRALFSSNPGQ